MRRFTGLVLTGVILAFGVLAAVAWPKSDVFEKIESAVFVIDDWDGTDVFDPDPAPVTEFVEPLAEAKSNELSVHQLQIVGRLAEGIVRFKDGQWWECGEKLSSGEIEDRAVVYAYEIVRAAGEVSDAPDKEGGFVLNPWGLAGVIRNESQFDRCALGTHPRKTAYRLGLLERRKRCISHTEKEILDVVRSDDMNAYYKRTGFDLGTAQLLSRFYANPRDFEYMISLRGGTTEAAYQMRKRGRMFKTERPWLYWRGYHCEWYDEKISRWARQLGATSSEI